MKKNFSAVILALLAVCNTAGCGGNGARTSQEALAEIGHSGYPVLDSYIAHFDNMIKILSDNKNDIEKASRELELYREKYGQEMDKLEDEITSKGATDPVLLQASVRMLAARHEQLESLRNELVKNTLQ